MKALELPSADALRVVPELATLASLAVALALAREAIGAADAPDEPDPLLGACPDAADLVLHHLTALEGALTRYRAILEDRYLRTIF